MGCIPHRRAFGPRIFRPAPVDSIRMDTEAVQRAIIPTQDRLEPDIRSRSGPDLHPRHRHILDVLLPTDLLPSSEMPVAHELWY